MPEKCEICKKRRKTKPVKVFKTQGDIEKFYAGKKYEMFTLNICSECELNVQEA